MNKEMKILLIFLAYFLCMVSADCTTVSIYPNQELNCTNVTDIVINYTGPGTLYVWKDGQFIHSSVGFVYEPVQLNIHLHNYTFTVNGTDSFGLISVNYCCYDHSISNLVFVIILSIIGGMWGLLILFATVCYLASLWINRPRKEYSIIV